jgi:hypothetical protein
MGRPKKGADTKSATLTAKDLETARLAAQKALFLKAIPGSGGIIASIARKTGVAWHTAKKFIEDHEDVRVAYQDEIEMRCDLAEGVILQAIQKQDIGTAKWYLALKGKERGYSDKVDPEGNRRFESPALTVVLDYDPTKEVKE